MKISDDLRKEIELEHQQKNINSNKIIEVNKEVVPALLEIRDFVDSDNRDPILNVEEEQKKDKDPNPILIEEDKDEEKKEMQIEDPKPKEKSSTLTPIFEQLMNISLREKLHGYKITPTGLAEDTE